MQAGKRFRMLFTSCELRVRSCSCEEARIGQTSLQNIASTVYHTLLVSKDLLTSYLMLDPKE